MSQLTEKELIEKLETLKKIKPDENWVIFCREKISAELSSEVEMISPDKVNITSKASILGFISRFLPSRAVLRPALAFGMVFGFLFISSIFVLAKAKVSLPGDHLFPIKLALEQARLLTMPSVEEKANMQSDMVAKRLDELNQILGTSESNEAKKTKIEEAVNNLQKQLITMKDDLPKLSNIDGKKAIQVAKNIDAKASEVSKALTSAKATLSSGNQQNLSAKIAETVEIADKTSTNALGVMVQKQPDDGMSQEEILAKLEEKIQKTAQKIRSIHDSVASSSMPIYAAIILDESDKALDKAKASLEQKDTAGTFETVRTASDLATNAEKLVENAVSEQVQPDQPKDDSSSTTPSSTVPNSTSTRQSTEPPAPVSGQILPEISVFGATISN